MKDLNKIVNFPKIGRGNVLSLHYLIRARNCFFKGICISLKKQKLKNKNAFLILRNVLNRIAIEMSSPLFSINMLNVAILASHAKKYQYKKSKLLYLRRKVNKRSIIRF
jgi:ribosomal protein L19